MLLFNFYSKCIGTHQEKIFQVLTQENTAEKNLPENGIDMFLKVA